MKLRRIVYALLIVCLGALMISRFDAIAKGAVPYAAPKRPAITGRKSATPKPTIVDAPDAQALSDQDAQVSGDQDAQSLSDQDAQAVAALAEQPTPSPQKNEPGAPVIDVSRASEGYISASYSGGGTDHVLRIQANGQKIDYRTSGDGQAGTAQLTFGDGEYTITYLIRTSGSKYAVGASAKCYYEAPAGAVDGGGGAQSVQQISADDARFLGVTSEINWNAQQSAIQKAASLAGEASGTKDKVKKIYTYIIQNILYDYSVYGKLPSGYLPDIERTYTTGKGICYDFSALFGGMLRSQGIPAKLCKGSSTFVSGYHAWNAVLIDSQWYIIDTSSDAVYVAGNVSPKMFKSAKDYSVSKES